MAGLLIFREDRTGQKPVLPPLPCCLENLSKSGDCWAPLYPEQSDQAPAISAPRQALRFDTERAGDGGEATAPAFLVDDVTSGQRSEWQIETAGHRKSKFTLKQAVANMVKAWGIGKLGFHTRTFSEDVQSMEKAMKLFRAVCKHVFPLLYDGWAWSVERSENGRIHFHVVVAFKGEVDVRTGFDFESVKLAKAELQANGRTARFYQLTKAYSATASEVLHRDWAFWRAFSAKRNKWGVKSPWGRTETLPIRKIEAIAEYVAAYIGKHVGARLEEDKGARLWGASMSVRRAAAKAPVCSDQVESLPVRCSSSFSWARGAGWVHRRKMEWLADYLQLREEDFPIAYGRNWGFECVRILSGFRLQELVGKVVYPSAVEYRADNPHSDCIPEDALGPVTVSGSINPASRLAAQRLAVKAWEYRRARSRIERFLAREQWLRDRTFPESAVLDWSPESFGFPSGRKRSDKSCPARSGGGRITPDVIAWARGRPFKERKVGYESNGVVLQC